MVWTMTAGGVAKHTPLSEYPVQGRGGSGVITMKLPLMVLEDGLMTTGKLDHLAAAVIGAPDDLLAIRTQRGRYRVIPLKGAMMTARAKPGADAMASLLIKNDKVIGVTRIVARPVVAADSDN